MPGRKIPLITGQIYHVFNHGIYRTTTFTNKRDYQRAKLTINFYKTPPPVKLSLFLTLSNQKQQEILAGWQGTPLVKILSYVLMPNHFHFLLEQTTDNGISKFMSDFQNSYTRYFNTRQERKGPLFLGQFKAVRIETEEQLYYVSRYIHLNPYSSYLAKTPKNLEQYPWSSLPEYLGTANDDICDKSMVLAGFRGKKDYHNFVFNNADYQRSLEEIKHLITE